MGVSVIAGLWQYGRHLERAEALTWYELAEERPAATLSDVTSPRDDRLALEATWRRVSATGHFSPEQPTLLRNRPVDQSPTYQYLAWFITTEGSALLVNAGWQEAPSAGGEPPAPELPRSEVTIDVILREWEPDDGRRDAGATRIHTAQVPPPPAPPVPAYGMLRDSCEASGPCVSSLGLADVPLPYLSTGPHLSYAWQWWVFAALAPVGATLLLRREVSPSRPVRAPKNRASGKRGLSDEDIEDAL